MRKVVVVGGGIAGLSCAWRLSRSPTVEVTLLEGSPRLGGKITTERAGGLILEGGPDAFITVKPEALASARELGLGPRLMPTSSADGDVSVFVRGKLRKLPEGLLLMAPSKIVPFLLSDVVTWPGKLRMAMDLVLPRGGGGDETLGAFTRRRLGDEALETIVQPIMAGIYGGDADRLSLRSTFPRFIDLEKKYRSVILGLRAGASRKREGDPRITTFMSLKGGLIELIEALASRLGGRVRSSALVSSVRRDGARWRVALKNGESLDADAVVLTPVSSLAADLLVGEGEDLLGALRAIPCSSTATLSLAYAKGVALPPGFGFVVPRAEPGAVSAGTFTSTKFPNRSPDGAPLMRLFLGGEGREASLDAGDDALIAQALTDVERMLGIAAEPTLKSLKRWPKANPQYHSGHAARVAAIDEALKNRPGLYLAGASYHGIGIADCIASGERAAKLILGLG